MGESLNQCDIIMKGGITSGVVYPKAIVELAKKFQFNSIGGTSAGAIAAALTAAAEYNRPDGFKVLDDLPDELSHNLSKLFQPTPKTRAVFDACVAKFSEKSWPKAIRCIVVGHWLYFLSALLLSALFGYFAWRDGNGFLVILLALGTFASGIVASLWRIFKVTGRILCEEQNFGLCPGRTQPDNDHPGLCDWLADKIEIAAGRMQKGGPRPRTPLTFNDIWCGKDKSGTEQKKAVDLLMMTTNVTLRQPSTLPYMDENSYFKEDEFRAIFPDWIVDYLVATSKATHYDHPIPTGHVHFPSAGALPLIVAARMSLSFPFMFSTVPIYRVEYPSMADKEADKGRIITKMLFSDGGLSSNFPVHFFDALLPTRPTFGISLEDTKPSHPNWRVHLPLDPGDGIWPDAQKIETVGDFTMGLVNAAKDWQDHLQSTLPGYRERIVRVYLKENEGGANLTMPKETINLLGDFGRRAAGLMTGHPEGDDKKPFDFDNHRWRRFLVAFARIEETLHSAADTWSKEGFAKFVADQIPEPISYRGSSKRWREQVFERFNALMAMASLWKPPLLVDHNQHIPKPQTDMRITPKAYWIKAPKEADPDHGSSSVSQ